MMKRLSLSTKIQIGIFLLAFASPSHAVGTILVNALITAGTISASQVFLAAAIRFVVNFAVSTLITRIFGKKPPKPKDNGVRQQVPPSSTNSIPVVYGDAWLGGVFVDAVISTNQKVMWYTMAISNISPNGQFTFDKTKFYYGDRLVTFDTTEPAKVVSLTDGSGNVDTKIADNLYIYLYRSDENGVITNLDTNGTSPGSGLPNTIMTNAAGVPAGLEWPATNRQMNGLAFAIIKLIYSQEDDATQLQPVTFYAKHYLNGAGVAKPGDVWYDYLNNAKYGGAVDAAYISSATATALNNYSDELITYTNNSGNPATQPRYRINGVIDTGSNVLENIDDILVACDSWMAYDAPTGQWSIVINKADSASLNFDDTNIIGDIRVSTIDITQALNQIEVEFPNKLNKDIPSYVFLQTPVPLLYPNEPVNKYSTQFNLVNDSVQAQYLANRILEQAREDLLVTIKTTYYGIQANAGDVVSITNASYGWNGKLFRAVKVNEAALDDGSLGAQLELSEYNAQVYDDKPITEFQPAPNTEIPSPNYFSALAAPTISDQLPTAAVPSFSVNCVIPVTGRVTRLTLYYTTVSTPTTLDWQLLAQQSATNSQAYTNGSTVKFTNVILPAATYYFAFKVGNEAGLSVLSPSSTGYAWSPNPTATVTGSAFVAQFSPPVLQVPYTTVPSFTGITPQLYGTVAGGAIDYVAAATDADPLFVNNSWRIGASSTTGLGDIVKSGITIGNPTDGGNYALFPQPTAMSTNPATIDVPIRYKDSLGNVTQSATAICQLTFNQQGATGTSGDKTATVYLYQWSTSTPANPNGTSTYTWASGANTSYTGTNGWSTTVPANPGTPLIQLWTATKSITAAGSAVSTTVDWSTGFTVQALSQNGATGASGVQSATATVFQWAISIPAGPTGTSTYTWSTNTFSPTPAGWTLTGGTAPSAGYTLWAARVNLVDSATVTTSTINWTTASIAAVGYAGTNGTNGATGTTGNSARICYSKTSLSSLASSPSTITTSGSTSFPPDGSWGADTVWQATPPAISAGESVYQSDGIYSPTTNQTVWNVPYLSALKVGSLSAISANLGTITAGSITGVTITGGTIRTSSGTSRVELANSTNDLRVYNSSGTVILQAGGTGLGASVKANSTTLGGPAVWGVNTGAAAVYGEATTGDGIYGSVTSGRGVYGYNTSTSSPAVEGFAGAGSGSPIGVKGTAGAGSNSWGVYGVNTASGLGVYALASGTAGTSHALRGTNQNGASGLIATNSNYDFYAEGTGTNYGPFTGTHDALSLIGESFEIGDIVVDQAIVVRKSVSSTISQVATSTIANEPAALGVVCALPRPLSEVQLSAYIEGRDEGNSPIMSAQYYVDCNIYNFMPVNSVGEGQINVCGEGGDIAAGDLIVTSSTPGKGMKQSDNILRSITVAKAREAVTFSSPTEIKMIACIYVSG